jgi:hypothetical protein
MYHQIGIDALSNPQIGRMLRGLPTTIKRGATHAINVSSDQLKKAGKAFQMGKGIRLTMDPYQLQQHMHLHGTGIMSSMKKAASKVKSVYNANKAVLQPMLHQAGNKAISMVSEKLAPLASKYGMQNVLDSVQDAAVEKLEGTGPGRRRMQRGGSFKSVMKKVGGVAKSALKNPAIRSMVTSGIDAAAMSVGVPPGTAEMGLKLAGLGVRGRPRKGGALYGPGHGGALFPPGR